MEIPSASHVLSSRDLSRLCLSKPSCSPWPLLHILLFFRSLAFSLSLDILMIQVLLWDVDFCSLFTMGCIAAGQPLSQLAFLEAGVEMELGV